MERQILCYEVPAFEIALARIIDARLRDCPVGIARPSPRALLGEVSQEAVQEGLSPGMPVAVGRRLCPGLRLISPDSKRVQAGEEQILTVVQRYVPIWERLTPGALLCDVTGTERLFGRALDIGVRIEKEVVQRYRLEGVMGVGTNRLVAQLAAGLVRPIQAYDVWPGSEERFVRPLLVDRLPFRNDPDQREIGRRLRDLHLTTFGDLAGLPYTALALAFPRHVDQLSQWAHGQDAAPVRSLIQQHSVERYRLLSPDSIDHRVVEAELYRALEDLCMTLRGQQRACRALTVLLTYADGQHMTRRASLKRSSCWERDWWPVVLGLVSKFQRRQRIRAVGLHAENMECLAEQLALFPELSPEGRSREQNHRLAVTLDQLRARFGECAVLWGQAPLSRRNY